MTIGEKLHRGTITGTGAPLTSTELAAVGRAIDVLRRIAENDCTNAQKEAADIMMQIDR